MTKNCSMCRGVQPIGDFYKHPRLGTQSRCKVCTREAARSSYRKNPEATITRARTRDAHIRFATPPWSISFVIEEAYRLAPLRTKATGLLWHVDHIVPLTSKLVCGLHSHTNIQVIPASENMAKGNRSWPDQP